MRYNDAVTARRAGIREKNGNRMITVGIRGEKSVKVTNENTAASMGSGLLPVFATPSLAALMEKTCAESVQTELEEGFGTVGTLITCAHTSASPVGCTVTCKSELVEVDRRRLVFRVTASDELGPVGEGTHERFIIDNARFMKKAEEKAHSLKEMRKNAAALGKPTDSAE